MDKIEKFLNQDYHFAQDKNAMLEILQIGRKNGFENIQIRKRLWPIILSLDLEEMKQSMIFGNWISSHANKNQCKEYSLVQKDIDRVYIFGRQQIEEQYIIKNKKELTQIINSILLNNPDLSYFQGFHDIAMALLLIFGQDSAYHMIDKISHLFLKDYFKLPFQNTLMVLDKIIFEIVMRTDIKYQTIFKQFNKQFGFTIPWIITWFSHSFHQISIIMRIWDFLICSTPDKIAYLCSAFVICLTQELIIQFKQKNKQYQYAYIFEFYQDISKIPIRMDAIILKTIQLQQKIQIKVLDSYKLLHQHSIIIQQNYITIFPLYQYKKSLQQLREKKKSQRNKNIIKFVGVSIALTGLLILTKKTPVKQFLKEIL